MQKHTITRTDEGSGGACARPGAVGTTRSVQDIL